MSDARAAAWLTAWDCLTAANRCREKAIDDPPVAEDYRAAMADLIALADRFTALVHAPEVVGAACGVELENRRDAEEERGRMTADMAEAFKKTRDEEQP